jgi:hypothetical protein
LLALDIVLPHRRVWCRPRLAPRSASAGLAASTLGMTACCQIGYAIGRTSGRTVAPASSASRLADVERWVRVRGDWMLCVMRPVPVLAEASLVLAASPAWAAPVAALTSSRTSGVGGLRWLASDSLVDRLDAACNRRRIVLPALVIGAASLARRRSRGPATTRPDSRGPGRTPCRGFA